MKKISILLLVLLTVTSWAENLPLSDKQIATLSAHLDLTDNTPLTWRGDPLLILLPLGKEKRIVFPEPIQADVNGALTTDQLRIINTDQNLYLTAQQSFPKTRIYITLKNSQQIILLDLTTSEQANVDTQKVNLPAAKKENNLTVEAKQQNSVSQNQDTNKTTSADAFVNALRFAWQQLYAPERLLNNDVGYTRVPMRTNFWEPDLIYGDKVLAHPTASWQLDGLYVTAVELRNKYPHATAVYLSRDICGNWQAASLYPRHNLAPIGQKQTDNTMLFLVSDKPFSQAMELCHGGV